MSGPLVWVTNGRRSAVIAMLGSSLRMLQFRLGMDGLCRSTKQGGLSFAPARIRVGPNTCFSTAAAAAAAAGASLLLLLLLAYLLLVGPARCFFFFFQLSCESCTRMMDVVRTLKKVPGTSTNNT